MLEIRHTIPGRTRIKYSGLKASPLMERAIRHELRKNPGVRTVRCNTAGLSIVIQFDPRLLDNTDLIRMIHAVRLEDLTPSSFEPDAEAEADRQRRAIQKQGMEFLALTGVTAGIFIRTQIMKAALSQTLFSPLGLIGVFFSVPLVKKALKDLKKKKEVTLNTFLAGGIVAALAAGEAVSALEILWIHSGSELLSDYVTERSHQAVRKILEVSEKSAFVMRGDEEVEIPVGQLHPGDVVTVHTGEKISIDGKILRGEAMVNEAPINGRSELLHRAPGDHVFAGTFVTQGVIYVEAEHVGDSTYLSRILFMVDESLTNKAQIELEADRLAKKLVNIGFIMTAGTFFLTGSFYRAFSVLLVMSCPCATILAASSAVSAALNNAAAQGILIKGGRYLEEAGSQSSFCFDKTGTLTNDHPRLTDIYALPGFTEDEVLQAAHIAELHSRHPLAEAVRSMAEERKLEHVHHTVCDSILGMGTRAASKGSEYLVGNSKLMKKYKIPFGALTTRKKEFQREGKTVMYVARDGQVMGLLCAANTIKPNVPYLIAQLRKEGIKELILLTGDEAESAESLARELGFDRWYASALPEEKAKIIQEIQKEHKVAMVGDGINDVLALTVSDLGIAMGAMGSDVAIEAADIALVDDDLEKIVHLRKLSKRTKEIIHQNFNLATGTNIGGAILGGLGLLNPVMAGLLHVAHTTGIVANSSRLLKYDYDKSKELEIHND